MRPFPGPGGKWRVSTGGGRWPRWSAAAHELLFLAQDKVMYAPYSVVGDSFRPEKPRPWSATGIRSFPFVPMFDIHSDGRRLSVVAAQEHYLRAIAPAKR